MMDPYYGNYPNPNQADSPHDIGFMPDAGATGPYYGAAYGQQLNPNAQGMDDVSGELPNQAIAATRRTNRRHGTPRGGPSPCRPRRSPSNSSSSSSPGGAASGETSVFPEPTPRMLAMNGSPDPGDPAHGSVSMTDSSGAWTFRPSQNLSEEDHLEEWRTIVKEGMDSMYSSAVLLPASLGGFLLRVILCGSEEELKVDVRVLDVNYNTDIQLPLTGRLKVDIEGRQAEPQFSLHEKLSYTTCATINTTGFGTEKLPKVVLTFTPV